MAYSGSTAGTTSANPPRKVSEGITGLGGTTGLTTAPRNASGQGGALWTYCSTNLTTDIVAAGFFSDGENLGMKPGDIVLAVQFSSAGSSVQLSFHAITGITTAGAAQTSTGATLTSTFS